MKGVTLDACSDCRVLLEEETLLGWRRVIRLLAYYFILVLFGCCRGLNLLIRLNFRLLGTIEILVHNCPNFVLGRVLLVVNLLPPGMLVLVSIVARVPSLILLASADQHATGLAWLERVALGVYMKLI